MKLAASYNLFDTEELLEASVKAIRSQVDYISVVYQTISNHGEKCSDGLMPTLTELHEKGLIEELIHYIPNLNISPQKNEIKKRNIGLKRAKKNKCTHFLSLDADEFYAEEEFAWAKSEITRKKVDVTAVRLSNYFKEPIYKMIYKDQPDYYVSFIFKIKFFQKFKTNVKFQVLIDPTRRIKGSNFLLFDRKNIEMHHMTLVRRHIHSKLMNSSANKLYKENNIEKYLDYFNNWQEGEPVYPPSNHSNIVEIEKVDNQFNIKI